MLAAEFYAVCYILYQGYQFEGVFMHYKNLLSLSFQNDLILRWETNFSLTKLIYILNLPLVRYSNSSSI